MQHSRKEEFDKNAFAYSADAISADAAPIPVDIRLELVTVLTDSEVDLPAFLQGLPGTSSLVVRNFYGNVSDVGKISIADVVVIFGKNIDLLCRAVGCLRAANPSIPSVAYLLQDDPTATSLLLGAGFDDVVDQGIKSEEIWARLGALHERHLVYAQRDLTQLL